ncbi:MAG: carboxypeptidase-like regulatory domain-containing protein [Janthinobacterium lividum]
MVAAIFLALSSVAQLYSLSGQIIDSQTNAGLPGATVLLKSDTTVVAACSTNQEGSFQLDKPFIKNYAIEVRCLGYRSKTVRFIGSAANPAPLRIPVPGFCPYAYACGRTPRCIGGHADHIVPIAYGLPNKQTMLKAGKGKLRLGGCETSGCDPRYYCQLHKKGL